MNPRVNMITGILQVAAYFMLPLSVGHWPYVFYQALRFIVTGAFLSMIPRLPAMWAILALGIAILFNPIIPFHFEKDVWSLLDGGALVLLCVIGSKQRDIPSDSTRERCE